MVINRLEQLSVVHVGNFMRTLFIKHQITAVEKDEDNSYVLLFNISKINIIHLMRSQKWEPKLPFLLMFF